jgi:hypothetical protein
MNPQDHIPALRAHATRILPGYRAARVQMDTAIHVLEYFESLDNEHNARVFVNFGAPPPHVLAEIEQLRAMLNCYCRLHAPDK